MKKCSSYLISNLQIKITVKYCCMPIAMAETQNDDHTKRWWACRSIRTLSLLLRMQHGAATLGDSMKVLTKLNILLLYHPTIVLLGIYTHVLKTRPHRNLHMKIYSSFTHGYENLEATKVSFCWRVDK